MRRALRALLLLAGPATAATAPPGAASCSGCHAQWEGAAIPAIAGRPAGEIADRMLAYRRSEGAPTVMDRIAKGFSEEEIRAIAAWISGAP